MTTLYRTLDFDLTRAKDDVIPVTVSTTTPVDRGEYVEILSHDPDAIDLSRAVGGLPLIEGHDQSRAPLGRVVDLRSDGTRLRGLVRFGSSTRARELLADVLSGVVTGVSVGYRILQQQIKGEQLIATRWQPVEASAVAVPADQAAGFFRSQNFGVPNMSENIEAADAATLSRSQRRAAVKSLDVETERVEAIRNVMRGYAHLLDENGRQLGESLIRNGGSMEILTDYLRARVATPAPPSAEIGLSQTERRSYSIVRALNYLMNPNDRKAREAAGFELEVSEAARDKLGVRTDRGGLRVPHEVFFTRDLTTSVASGTSKGGNLVATDHLANEFIDVLRNQTVVGQLGATMLPGLVGNVAIPKKSAGSSVYWVAENSAPTEGAITFSQVTMTPRTVAGYVDFSRRLMLQGTPAIEQIVRQDLIDGITTEVDRVALFGTGSNTPTGTANVSGIGSVTIGTNGGAPTWAKVLELIREVEIDNAARGRMAFVTNAKVRNKLAQTLKTTGDTSSNFILDLTQPDRLAGFPVVFSNQVPSNLTKGSSSGVCSALLFGAWNDLLIGMWSGIDLLVDTSTGSKEGTVRIVAFQDVDVAVRYPESFAACKDLTT